MVRAVRIEPSKPIIPADERQAGFNDTSAANPHGLLSLPTPRLLTNTQPVTDRTGDPSMLGVVDPVKQTVRSIARVARVGVVTRFASLRTSMAGPTEGSPVGRSGGLRGLVGPLLMVVPIFPFDGWEVSEG